MTTGNVRHGCMDLLLKGLSHHSYGENVWTGTSAQGSKTPGRLGAKDDDPQPRFYNLLCRKSCRIFLKSYGVKTRPASMLTPTQTPAQLSGAVVYLERVPVWSCVGGACQFTIHSRFPGIKGFRRFPATNHTVTFLCCPFTASWWIKSRPEATENRFYPYRHSLVSVAQVWR